MPGKEMRVTASGTMQITYLLLQIKGLFNNSLPAFLKVQAVYAGLDDPVR
jgi:hypothetical protein